MENLIILFNRARRFLLGTQEKRFKHLLGESQNELLESAAVLTYLFQHVSDDVTQVEVYALRKRSRYDRILP
jgi:hypothetical protein